MRFGRKQRAAADEETAAPPTPRPVAEGAPERGRARPDAGPFDVAEVDLEEGQWVDLGSLLLPPPTDVELRLQVDETTQQVAAVLLVGQTGALELRPFAASRGGGAWDELRPRIAAETARVGGTATETDGAFGTELVCLVPVTNQEGQQATQANRFAGHEGPTWLLRTNLLGQPAVEDDAAGPWHDLIRSVVVRRGAGPMAPGTPLPLTLPPEARQMRPGEGATGADPTPDDSPDDGPDDGPVRP